ncbi:MAG: terminase family protein [Deltaproteobacteria bacterium]|nr:terminase family protein [Deltaproteobacteria bacterium]
MAAEDQPIHPPAREVIYRARPHQLRVLNSRKKLVFMGGGVGSGKTDVGSLWALGKAAATPPGVLGLVAANSYTQLVDSTLRNLYKNWTTWGVDLEPATLPRRSDPWNLAVHTGRGRVEILCRSLESYQMLAGVELGWAWLDECFLARREAVDLILARLRDRRMAGQVLLTTTLDEPGSWLHQMFVENFDPALMDVFYATTYDNQANLPPGYIEGLQAAYPRQLFQRMVLAKWVALGGESIYYNFARAAHVREDAEFEPQRDLLWALDFNIGRGKPMSSCLAQIRPGRDAAGRVRPELVVFDEIILETADTGQAVTEFQARPWLRELAGRVRIYGDASGHARDTRSRVTDYAILREAGFPDQRVPARNPPLRDRHNAVNALLKNAAGDVRLSVHPRCRVLIQGLESVRLKQGADYLEEETFAQHVTTALGYLICREFPLARATTSFFEAKL